MHQSTSQMTVDRHIGCYVGWYLVDSRPIYWRHSVTTVYRSIVGWYFADGSLTHHWHLADIMVEDYHRYVTNTRPTINRYVADTLLMLSRPTVGRSVDRYETQWKHHSTEISVDTRLILDRLSTDIYSLLYLKGLISLICGLQVFLKLSWNEYRSRLERSVCCILCWLQFLSNFQLHFLKVLLFEFSFPLVFCHAREQSSDYRWR